MHVIGQRNNIELITKLARGKRPKFIIIVGSPDSGKAYLAKYISTAFDVDYVPLGNKVSTIRELIESSDLKNNCVYHFSDFEKASQQAQGALLKITEETPEDVYIVLTINTSTFLDTLLSRAFLIHMEPYTYQDLQQYAHHIEMDLTLFAVLYQLGADTPPKLYKLNNLDYIDELVRVVEAYGEAITSKTLSDVEVVTVFKQFQRTYKPDEVDNALLFLELLVNYLVKHDRAKCSQDRIELILNSIDTIKYVPTINRQFVLSTLIMELRNIQ